MSKAAAHRVLKPARSAKPPRRWMAMETHDGHVWNRHMDAGELLGRADRVPKLQNPVPDEQLDIKTRASGSK